jgi:hypothetical protein
VELVELVGRKLQWFGLTHRVELHFQWPLDELACAAARFGHPWIRFLYIFLRQPDCLAFLSRHLSRFGSLFGPDFFFTVPSLLTINFFLCHLHFSPPCPALLGIFLTVSSHCVVTCSGETCGSVAPFQPSFGIRLGLHNLCPGNKTLMMEAESDSETSFDLTHLTRRSARKKVIEFCRS